MTGQFRIPTTFYRFRSVARRCRITVSRATLLIAAATVILGELISTSAFALPIDPPDPSGQFGLAVADAGDVNNDGYGDIIIGAPFAGDDGQAYLFWGGSNPDATVDLVLNGQGTNSRFGFAVSSAGDFNGDGYDDILIGAERHTFTGEGSWRGRAYIFFGGPTPDSQADLIFDGELPNDEFGQAVACAGDVNNDNYSDIIIGARAPFRPPGEGRAYIFLGGSNPDTAIDLIFTEKFDGGLLDGFGCSVGGAVDVNNDGYSDVIVGALATEVLGANTGRAYVYFGGSQLNSDADLVLTGEAAQNYFGSSVAGAGDINGDNYDDVIIGARGHELGGRAYVFLGGVVPDGVPDLVLTGEFHGDAFGHSVSAAGDVNNDGFGDLVVGAQYSDVGADGAGRAYVFFGENSPDAIPDQIFTGESGGDRLGGAVSAAGDVNGDHIADLILGAPTYSDDGGSDGRAYLLVEGRKITVCFEACMSGVENAGEVCVIGSAPELGYWLTNQQMIDQGGNRWRKYITLSTAHVAPREIQYKYQKDDCITWEQLPAGPTINRLLVIDAETPDSLIVRSTWEDGPGLCDFADLAVTKSVSNPTPGAGETIRYTISVYNNGPDVATGVAVIDTLPATVAFITQSSTQGIYDLANRIWSAGEIAAGAGDTLWIDVQVNAGTEGTTIHNSATVFELDQVDSESENNSDSASITPATDPITGEVEVHFTLCMSGIDPVGTVCLSGSPPELGEWGTGVTMSSLDQELWQATVVFPIGTESHVEYKYRRNNCEVYETGLNRMLDLPVDGTAEVELPPDSFERISPLLCGFTEPLDHGVTVYFQVCLAGVPNSGDVCVVGSVPELGGWGDDVAMTDLGGNLWQAYITFPAGQLVPLDLQYKFKKDDCATWEILPAGNSVNRLLTIDDKSPETIVSRSSWEDGAGECSLADLSVTKKVNYAFAIEGGILTYTVTVTNEGPDAVAGILVVDELPLGLTHLGHTASQGSYDLGMGLWTVGEVPVSGSDSLMVEAILEPGTAGGTITNTANVMAPDLGDPNSDNDVVSVVTQVSTDVIPPSLLQAVAVSSTQVLALFSEPLRAASARNPANYILFETATPGNLLGIVSAEVDNKSVTLSLANSLSDLIEYTLVVSRVRDIAGHIIGDENTASFLHAEVDFSLVEGVGTGLDLGISGLPGVDSFTGFFRIAGVADYSPAAFEGPAGGPWLANLSVVSEDRIRGIEFYASAGNISLFLGTPGEPIQVPFSGEVAFPDLSERTPLMVSAPMEITGRENTPGLLSFLGAEGKDRDWIMGTYHAEASPPAYSHVNSTNPSAFAPGIAYWIITRANQTGHSLSGTSWFPQQARDYLLFLRHGWNMVGNPAAYTVSLDRENLRIGTGSEILSFTEAAQQGLVSPYLYIHEAGRSDPGCPDDYICDVQGLSRWGGCWVRNLTQGELTLMMPAREYSLSGKVTGHTSQAVRSSDVVTVSVQSDGETRRVELGVGASTTPDLSASGDVDLPPPAPRSRLSVGIRSALWGSEQADGRWFRKILPEGANPLIWEIDISGAGDLTELRWYGPGSAPPLAGDLRFSDRSLILHDMQTGREWDMAELTSLTLEGGQHVLAVQSENVSSGTHSSILEGVRLLAAPNPFRTETTLMFHLSQESGVSLKVFDLRGRVIWRLNRVGVSAGNHAIVWGGSDMSGRRVAAGMYFLRLEATSVNQNGGEDQRSWTRKIILLQ